MEHKKLNKVLNNSRKVVVFYPELARKFGGINEALVFQQIVYWERRGKRKDEGIVYKTDQELENETTLTSRQLKPVRDKLKSLGVIKTWVERVNGIPKTHYQIIWEVVEKLFSVYDKKSETSITENTTDKAFLSEERKAQLSPSEVEEIVTYFINKWRDMVGFPLLIGVKERQAIRRALNSGGLSGENVIDMIDAAIMDKPDKEAMSLAAILSNQQINLYKVANIGQFRVAAKVQEPR